MLLHQLSHWVVFLFPNRDTNAGTKLPTRNSWTTSGTRTIPITAEAFATSACTVRASIDHAFTQIEAHMNAEDHAEFLNILERANIEVDHPHFPRS